MFTEYLWNMHIRVARWRRGYALLGIQLDTQFEDPALDWQIVLHDYIHLILNLGISLEEEDLVAQIENALLNGASASVEVNTLVERLDPYFVLLYRMTYQIY